MRLKNNNAQEKLNRPTSLFLVCTENVVSWLSVFEFKSKKINCCYASIIVCVAFFNLSLAQTTAFSKLCAGFVKTYDKLNIPVTSLDYKTNFSNIKPNEQLQKQLAFFKNCSSQLDEINIKTLSNNDKWRYNQLKYEIALNIERISLEQKWNNGGRIVPENGLYQLTHHKEWYSYYVKYFTSVNITPEKVFEMGESEVKKIQKEIKKIQLNLGYNDEHFYNYLQSDTFYFKEKEQILAAYSVIDKTARKNINKLFPLYTIPEITVMDFPNSTANTPPGIYLGKESNSLGKPVFQFNFYGHLHNKRSMDWLYMHEAIPGHHLQVVAKNNNNELSKLKNKFFYFGNAEGWACYVEDFGKEIGLYQNDYTYLGKWQWDLVRSARLVMEVGIHYYGWDKEKAMNYWKDNIKGQDEIANREITRITNWAGQALCYKVGALTIKKIIDEKIKQGNSIVEAHQFLLSHSDFPLEVLLYNIQNF